ncbi:MAG: sulfite exporter TauE/SafE family protein [Minisyncoccota bacterium]
MFSLAHFLIYGVLGVTTFINIVVPISGSAIVTPLLALLTDPHQAIGIVSAFFVMSGIVRTFTFRASIQWSEIRVLLLPSVIAAAVGAFTLVAIPEEWLLVIILLFSLYFLFKKLRIIPKRKRPSSVLNHFIGLLSGFLQGTGLAGSDLRNQYLYAQDLSIAEVHGTTSLIGTSNFFIATLTRFYAGQLTLPVIEPLLYLLPVVIFAIWLGKRALYKIPQKISDRIVIGVMVVVVLSLAYEILSRL